MENKPSKISVTVNTKTRRNKYTDYRVGAATSESIFDVKIYPDTAVSGYIL